LKKICVVILTCVSVCAAQDVRALQGEIHSATPADLSWLTVGLEKSPSRESVATSQVTVGGQFDFRGVPEGTYTLKVMDRRGNEVMSQPLLVGPANPAIDVRLPSELTARPTGETTSVARLRHSPTKRALDAARRGQKFSESGDYVQAAAEWKKAVEADPEFSEAHGNLGAQYARLGRAIDAVTEFQRAITLDPSTAQHQSNLAVAMAQLGRLEEAEVWARRAVTLDGGNPLGHYVLGCVLASQAAKSGEAIQQLQLSARRIPKAHERLAQLYHALGKQELAWEELRAYVETEPVGGQPQLKSWTSPLR
jgi:Flp pilus assembly protein TadD